MVETGETWKQLLPDTTVLGYLWQLAASGLISSHIKDMNKLQTKAHPAHSATVEQIGYSLTYNRGHQSATQ